MTESFHASGVQTDRSMRRRNEEEEPGPRGCPRGSDRAGGLGSVRAAQSARDSRGGDEPRTVDLVHCADGTLLPRSASPARSEANTCNIESRGSWLGVSEAVPSARETVAELMQYKMGDLRGLARSVGASDDEMDEALDSEAPKQSLASLILAKRRASLSPASAAAMSGDRSKLFTAVCADSPAASMGSRPGSLQLSPLARAESPALKRQASVSAAVQRDHPSPARTADQAKYERVLHELLQTERRYYRHLDAAIEQYGKPLRHKGIIPYASTRAHAHELHTRTRTHHAEIPSTRRFLAISKS
jgi:hypothetical protein